VYKIVVRIPEGRRHLEDSDIQVTGCEEVHSLGSGEEAVMGSCEHGNQSSGSIIAANVLIR
jgi:hypothetical protein